jgi:sugar phosphate isomerase/epimerase
VVHCAIRCRETGAAGPAEHIPQFEEEIRALREKNIELFAWWFPQILNEEGRQILALLGKHKLSPQLWVMGGGQGVSTAEEQAARVKQEAGRIKPIAIEAGKIGSKVGLYNHGGWFGEPENQIAIIELLKKEGVENVGIVYNQHHGYDQAARLAELLRKMKPYLIALNLNGMVQDGEEKGLKIVPIGAGELDVTMIRIIAESEWKGPVGILNHTNEDAEGRLLDNIEGLEWVVKKAQGADPGPPPNRRTWKPPTPR